VVNEALGFAKQNGTAKCLTAREHKETQRKEAITSAIFAISAVKSVSIRVIRGNKSPLPFPHEDVLRVETTRGPCGRFSCQCVGFVVNKSVRPQAERNR
jgi:hypothetical protein